MTKLQLLTSGPADGTAASTGNTGASLVNTGTGGSSVWKNSVGAHSNTGVLQTTVTSGQSNAMRFSLSSAATAMQATAKITLPSSAVGAEYQLLSFRHASGRCCSIVIETNNQLRFLDSANTITNLGTTSTFTLGTQYVVAFSGTGAGSGAGGGAATIHIYAVGGSTALATGTPSGQNFTTNQFAAIDSGGGTAVGNHGIVDLQVNDGSGSEIADYVPTSPLSDPVLTFGTTTNASTVGGSDGSQVVSWSAVTNATSYNAYISTVVPSPLQTDFTLVATGVTSPYTFTGLAHNSYAYGIKALP